MKISNAVKFFELNFMKMDCSVLKTISNGIMGSRLGQGEYR